MLKKTIMKMENYEKLINSGQPLPSDESYTSESLEEDSYAAKCCIICNGSSGLRSLSEDFSNAGVVENYCAMLERCFNIMFTIPKNDTINAICVTCTCRLRQCVEFRKDVELAHTRFTLYLRTGKEALVRTLDNTPPATSFLSPRLQLLDNLKQEFYDEKEEYCDTMETNYSDSDINEPFCKLTDYLDDFNDDIVEFSIEDCKSDDEWSVTSAELDRATRHPQSCKKETTSLSSLDKSATECPICLTKISDWKALSVHYKNHTPRSLCYICGFNSTNKDISAHFQSHSSVRYSCTLCERTYSLKNSLKQHVRTFHQKQKLNKCSECNKRFGDSRARRNHMMKEHGSKFRMLECTYCDRAFFSQYYLKLHVDNIHLRKKRVFCSLCCHGFFTNSELTAHLLTHTGVKEHECEYCGKCFRKKYHLTMHMKIHLNIKNYKCNHCDKAFVQKCALQGHLKTHGV